MLKAIFGALGNLAGAFGAWLKMSERRDHVRAGRNEEKLEQHERAQNAEDRMDGVDRGNKRSLLNRLRGSGKI